MCAFADDACDLNGPTMPADNVGGDRQPQTGAQTNRLGGEKRLKDFFFDLLRHARAGIADFNKDHFTVKPGVDANDSLPLHGLGCIEQKIEENLAQLLGENSDTPAMIGGQIQPSSCISIHSGQCLTVVLSSLLRSALRLFKLILATKTFQVKDDGFETLCSIDRLVD